MRRKLFFSTIFLLSAAPAWSSFKPRNPHLRQAHRRVAVSTGTATGVIAASSRLEAGRWDPLVAEAVDDAVVAYGKSSPDYDAASPPDAVLPVDGLLVKGDAGELVFQKLVREAQFKFDDGFWQIVPVTYGRQKIRAAYKQFKDLPRDTWDEQPTYHQYVKYFIQSYQDMCVKVGRKDCRIYLARLMRGFGYKKAADYAKGVLDEEARRPPSDEKIGESDQDPSPVIIHHGFVPVPETMDLARVLLGRGFDVWLCDLDAAPVLEAAADELRLGQARKAGIVQEMRKNKQEDDLDLTGDVHEPVPTRGGKVDAIVSATGRTPLIVVGASPDDLDLLSYGNGFRLLIGGQSPASLELARQRRWRLQPAFP